MANDHLKRIMLWLTKLALLTAGGRTPPTKQQIGLYATILVDEVTVEAFTEASLHAVAAGCEFFPAYAVLKTALDSWIADHPVIPRVATELSENLRHRIEEMSDHGAHHRRTAEERAEAKADWSDPAKIRASVAKIGEDHPMRHYLGRMLAALVGKHAPENLAYLPPEFLA